MSVYCDEMFKLLAAIGSQVTQSLGVIHRSGASFGSHFEEEFLRATNNQIKYSYTQFMFITRAVEPQRVRDVAAPVQSTHDDGSSPIPNKEVDEFVDLVTDAEQDEDVTVKNESDDSYELDVDLESRNQQTDNDSSNQRNNSRESENSDDEEFWRGFSNQSETNSNFGQDPVSQANDTETEPEDQNEDVILQPELSSNDLTTTTQPIEMGEIAAASVPTTRSNGTVAKKAVLTDVANGYKRKRVRKKTKSEAASEAIAEKKKKHTCRECGYECDKNANMIKHMRIHTGERPYKCSQCAKTFVQNSNLLQHLRSHKHLKSISDKNISKK